ncbi:hypothetical protein ACJDT4_06450 [Clostridium neuense]|uniref:Mannosyltransferase related to Gpi18 n=1 Tax=Clostridium neuense TaxID=1728934 RepID=A0ABW8TEA6_9CLOT
MNVNALINKLINFFKVNLLSIIGILIFGLGETELIKVMQIYSLGRRGKLALLILFLMLFCFVVHWYKTICKETSMKIIFMIILALTIYIRISMFKYMSGDYIDYLKVWIDKMRQYPGVESLGKNIGNYNPPYMYILFIISKFKMHSLYLIKYVSTVFDYLIAIYVFKMISKFTGEKSLLPFISFFAFLCLPTVILNSAMWGQCDSIYASFCLMGLYYTLNNKKYLGIILFSTAFCFKLQSIFILPIILVFIFKGEYNIKHLILFPITFFIELLPDILCGRPLNEVFMIYFNQADYVKILSANSPSLYSLVDNTSSNYEALYLPSLLVAATVMLLFICLIYLFKDALENRKYIEICFVLTLIIPYLLPKMHDRYFYLAEVFALLYVCLNKKKWYILPMTVAASLLAYRNYLFLERESCFALRLGSTMLLIVIVLTFKDVVYDELIYGHSEISKHKRI